MSDPIFFTTFAENDERPDEPSPVYDTMKNPAFAMLAERVFGKMLDVIARSVEPWYAVGEAIGKGILAGLRGSREPLIVPDGTVIVRPQRPRRDGCWLAEAVIRLMNEYPGVGVTLVPSEGEKPR